MIGHDIAAALPELRAHAESALTLTVRAWEPTGRVKNEHGMEVQQYADRGLLHAKFQGTQSAGRDTEVRNVVVGGVERPVLQGGLHIPLDELVPTAGQQGTGWEYEVLTAPDPADSALVGRRFLVVDAPVKSFATTRRLDVEEVTAP